MGFTSGIYESVYSGAVSVMVALRTCTLFLHASSRTMVVEAAVRKVLRGDVGTFQGYLRDAVTDEYLPNKTVILEKDGSEIGRATTPTSGYFFITYDFPTEAEATPHEYTLHFLGDEVYSETFSPVIAIMVEARVPLITFTITPTTTTVGATLTWYGELTDPKIATLKIPGATVYLQRDEVDTTDTAVTRSDTSAGRYQGTTTAPTVPGTYSYRTRYPGGAVAFGLYDGAVSTVEAVAAEVPPAAVVLALIAAPLVSGAAMIFFGTRGA